MKRKTTVVLGLACGVVCALCVGLYLQGVRGEVDEARAEALARYGGEQVEVVVAKRDIFAGEAVDASAVETQLWVADLLPEGAATSIEDVQDRVTASTILAGEVVSERRFEGETRQLDVPAGLIAVSVPAKDVQAVGGAITAGSRVDMYATGGTSTDLIASDVLVLATSAGERDTDSHESVSWITIAVKPDIAQGIVAAAQKMELYFTLPGEGAQAVNAKANDTADKDKRSSAADGGNTSDDTSQKDVVTEGNAADGEQDAGEKKNGIEPSKNKNGSKGNKTDGAEMAGSTDAQTIAKLLYEEERKEER
ncbi:Flp pilus assembly protein CpaB [Adlercreutzia sp. ZJ138]|uniref:Flp pilus assembly protein CpaB n=1 Tax=Adlercreutzia sp. ZJ138 TaxID=2709405 RepID=UPI0013EC6558|nr:Flp pilus assembly protein CpaB [Adlercreutzia sp. ZJ138]